MKHECSMCMRDNNRYCKSGYSFKELLFGKVKDCMLYRDYHKGLESEKEIKANNAKSFHKLKNKVTI